MTDTRTTGDRIRTVSAAARSTDQHNRLSLKLTHRRPPILIHPRRHAEYGIHSANGMTNYLNVVTGMRTIYRDGSLVRTEKWDPTATYHGSVESFLWFAQEFRDSTYVTTWAG